MIGLGKLLIALLLTLLVQNSQAELYIESDVVPADPYVQQQIVFTQSLYRDSHIQEGDFLRPDITGALMLPLEPDPPEQVTINGKEQEVVRQRYLLFPLVAGVLSLPAPVYSSRSLYVAGEPMQVEIRPLPLASNEPVIVTPQLHLSESWKTPDPPWQPGDHLQRIITIEAQQVTGAQLPRVNAQPIDGMQIQRLPGQVTETLIDEQLTGKRMERLLYIPEESGSFNIPPIEVTWWDVGKEQLSSAAISSRVLEVLPRGMRLQPPPPAPDTVLTPPTPSNADTTSDVAGISGWPYLAALAITALVILISTYSRIVEALRLARLSLSLRQACKAKDPQRAKELIGHWARVGGSNAGALSLISLSAKQSDVSIKEALFDLDRVIYSGIPTTWNGGKASKPLTRMLWTGFGKSTGAGKTPLPLLWEQGSN